MGGLRNAQQQLGSTLAEFLRLPQKLKMVFDLTKALSNEIGGLVPASLLHQAETQAAAARHAEQQHLFHVELLQRKLQALTLQGGLAAHAASHAAGESSPVNGRAPDSESPDAEAGDKAPGHEFAG